MKNMKEIKEGIFKYCEKKYGERKILFDPIFREYKNQYYLGFMVVELTTKDEIKRPTNWILADIVTGDILYDFDSSYLDYTTDLDLDTTFANQGNQSIYQYSNLIIESFKKWNRQLKEKLQELDPISNKKVLKLDNELISPRDYILSNIEQILFQTSSNLQNQLEGKLQSLYSEYYHYLLESIRTYYEKNNTIPVEYNQEYIDLLKYAWPTMVKLIDSFHNI